MDLNEFSTSRGRIGYQLAAVRVDVALAVWLRDGHDQLIGPAVDGTKVIACVSRENLITANATCKCIEAYQGIIADLTEACDQAVG